jgi:hypothetical protein
MTSRKEPTQKEFENMCKDPNKLALRLFEKQQQRGSNTYSKEELVKMVTNLFNQREESKKFKTKAAGA